jgi:hypothetical protein
MIVAHPDDELIFGGKELLSEPGWLVICITNGSTKSGNLFSRGNAKTRITEFITVMNTLKCKYQMWDYEDNRFNANWNTESLITSLKKLFSENNFKKIVTHNLQGEYGHIQHKKISELVHSLKPANLYVFDYVNNSTKAKYCEINPYLDSLKVVLLCYGTQKDIIDKYHTNIMYQNINKVS